MARAYARVDRANGRVAEIFELPDGIALLPFREQRAVLGENQMHGPAEVRITEAEAVYHVPAVRALIGEVAITDPKDGHLIEVRRLDRRVAVEAHVFLFEEVKPSIDARIETLEGPADSIEGDSFVRRWTVRDLSEAERAEVTEAEAAAEDRALRARLVETFGVAGLQALYEINNRIRAVEGEPPLSRDAFEAIELEKLKHAAGG